MKKCYLDSNFLIYLKNESSPFHKKSTEIIKNLVYKGINLYLSPLVVDEFLHIFAKHLRKTERKEIFSDLKRALRDILTIPLIVIVNPPTELNRQIDVVNLMQKYNLSARDAYHLLIVLYHKIGLFATFDADFNKVFKQKAVQKAQ